MRSRCEVHACQLAETAGACGKPAFDSAASAARFQSRWTVFRTPTEMKLENPVAGADPRHEPFDLVALSRSRTRIMVALDAKSAKPVGASFGPNQLKLAKKRADPKEKKKFQENRGWRLCRKWKNATTPTPLKVLWRRKIICRRSGARVDA